MNTEIYKEVIERLQTLEDNYARLKRTYDDLLYNLDDDNLSAALIKEKQGMKTQIKQTADSISLIAEDVSGLNSELTVMAGEISSKVSQGDLESASESIIQQTSDAIATKVSKTANYAGAHRGETPPADTSRLWYDTASEIYKYYNTVSETWIPVDGASIYSIFKQTTSGFEFQGNVAIKGDLIATGKITTAQFDGLGNDYIQMQREFITFRNDDLVKMALGFVKDKNGTAVPGIVFGAGDGQGNSRGYITKSTDGLDIFYITNSGNVARLRLDDDGKLYLNDTEIPAFDEDNPLQDEYIAQASTWNKAVIGTLSGGSYKVPTSKIIDGAVTDDKIADVSADKITAGVIDGDNVKVSNVLWLQNNDGEDVVSVHHDESQGYPFLSINAYRSGGYNVPIVLYSEGNAGVYIQSKLTENEVATKGYVQNTAGYARFG